MKEFLFFFEISDKIIHPSQMYIVFITLGGIGLLIGFWRWWVSLVWLIFPTLTYSIIFIVIQIDEINFLYKNIIREFGKNYIWHNYISVTIGILLNVLGLFVKSFGFKKLTLR